MMGWKYRSDDKSIEVIVDPDFQGDIAVLASLRPVWIVDVPKNGPAIDRVWAHVPESDFFEVAAAPTRIPANGSRTFWTQLVVLMTTIRITTSLFTAFTPTKCADNWNPKASE